MTNGSNIVNGLCAHEAEDLAYYKNVDEAKIQQIQVTIRFIYLGVNPGSNAEERKVRS